MIFQCAYCGRQYLDIDEAAACEKKCQEAAEEAKAKAEEEAQAELEAKKELTKMVREIETKLNKETDYINECKHHINSLKESVEARQAEIATSRQNIRDLINEYRALIPNCRITINENLEDYNIDIDIEEYENTKTSVEPSDFDLIEFLKSFF